MSCKTSLETKAAVINQHGKVVSSLLNMLTWVALLVVLLPSIASAQLVQSGESEAQLASDLCRHPTEATTNELLLSKYPQLINATLWNALLACAGTPQQQQPTAQSVQIYKLALRVAERLKEPELMATTYYHLGRTYSLMNDFENSINAYETSRRLFERVQSEPNLALVLADLGGLYLTTEDYDQAQNYSEQSLAIAAQTKLTSSKASLGPVEYGEARALQTLGGVDLIHGNHVEALRKLREALGLCERLDGSNYLYSIRKSEVLVSLAKVYGESSEYAEAFSYLTKAHQASKSSGDQNTLANIMSAQASLFHEQEDYAAAETYFNASLAIYRSLGNTRDEARVLLRSAIVEQQQGHHDSALRLFERSMELADAAKLVSVQIAAGEGLGAVLTAKRDFAKALVQINRSLDLARRVNAKSQQAELLWGLSQTKYAMQRYSESGELAQQALTLARSLRSPKLAYLATVALGEAYVAEGQIELAIRTLRDAVAQAEELRDHTTGRQETRRLFFENKIRAYHTLVKVLTKRGEILDALQYAERAKGRVLLEAVRRSTADLQDVLSGPEKDEAQRLHGKVLAIYQQMQSVSGNDPTGSLNNQLIAAKREFESFERKLAAAHPEVLLRAGPAEPLTPAVLNKLLNANDRAYLEYIVTNDTVGVFIIKRKGADPDLDYVSLPVTADELLRKVNEFQSALAERRPDYERPGRELYRLLIAPVANQLQDIKTICIVPDDFLWTLPFQALTTTRGNYFIQELPLFYMPSLTVLNEMRLRRRQPSSNESLIAFGNPVVKRDDELKQDLKQLPETETEVSAVARTLRTPMNRVLVGPQAAEKSFKALAPQYATIHLATHGVLDNRDPLNSYLLLTKTDGDEENDGLLHAREIIDLHLNADLAVLSACETGNGRVSPGEGMVGMSWAFFIAGARSVLVSQWQVNSASTSRLMKNFYEALARYNDPNSSDKASALTEASLRLMKDRRYRHPFYWAGFVLVSSN